MTKFTITEALADLKTIHKRIEKKQEYISSYLVRQDGIKDPLEKDGGSAEVIKRERQAISDLEKYFVNIRTAIQKANHENTIEIEGESKTIAEWLTWRKEISSNRKAFLNKIRLAIVQARTQATTKGWAVVPAGQQANNFTDLVVHVDEAELAKQAEQIETILGKLDGQLSLKNATIVIEVE